MSDVSQHMLSTCWKAYAEVCRVLEVKGLSEQKQRILKIPLVFDFRVPSDNDNDNEFENPYLCHIIF